MNQRNNKPPQVHGTNQTRGAQAGKPLLHKPGIAQPKMALSSQMKKPPVAPPVYRPQATPRVLQTKSVSHQQSQPGQSPRQPVAPPVYRPQPVPKVLQTKSASVQQSRAVKSPRQPVAPPVYRPQPNRIVQPKIAATAHMPVRGQFIQRKLSAESVALVAQKIFAKKQDASRGTVFQSIGQAVKDTKVSGFENTPAEKEEIQTAYKILRDAAEAEAKRVQAEKEAAAKKLKEEQEAAAKKLKEEQEAAKAIEAAKTAKIDNAFKPDIHKILTVELINLYKASQDYRVRAILEFDEIRVGEDKNYNYGVGFEIKKYSTDKVMYGHYHAHHNKDYTDVSGHFKTGMSKFAPQSWDLATDAAKAFTQELRNASLDANTWTVL